MESVPAPLSPENEQHAPLVKRKRGHFDGGQCGYEGYKFRARLGMRRPEARVCSNCTRYGYRVCIGHAELAASPVSAATSGLRHIVESGYAERTHASKPHQADRKGVLARSSGRIPRSAMRLIGVGKNYGYKSENTCLTAALVEALAGARSQRNRGPGGWFCVQHAGAKGTVASAFLRTRRRPIRGKTVAPGWTSDDVCRSRHRSMGPECAGERKS
jgi:hypothetical protein